MTRKFRGHHVYTPQTRNDSTNTTLQRTGLINQKDSLPDIVLPRTGTQTPTAEKNRQDIASRNTSLKRNPSLTHPWAKNAGDATKSGLVWLHINGKRIIDQQSKGVGALTVGKPDVQFAFLAPLAITETNAHNWGEYDSLASRLAQKVRTAAKVGAEWTAIKNSFAITPEDTAKNRTAHGATQGRLISDWLQKLYSKANSYSIPKLKVDTPLYYESSDRRTLNFEVMLIAESNPKSDIIDPVQDLMRFAAPDLQGGINIQFPYMFEVYTQPQEFLNYKTLALKSVQPTWNHPYINHYPSSCNLQLTFKDMSPLYRGTIESGSVINVREVGTGVTATASDSKPSKKAPALPKKAPVSSRNDGGGFNALFGEIGIGA